MAQVDQVTQRNASAAEELSSTAEEMSSQAEALLQTISFFQIRGAEHGSRAKAIHVPHLPASARPVAAPRRPELPHPAAVASKEAGERPHAGDGGFSRF
jgi:methyl-accepting chemotaxis protein